VLERRGRVVLMGTAALIAAVAVALVVTLDGAGEEGDQAQAVDQQRSDQRERQAAEGDHARDRNTSSGSREADQESPARGGGGLSIFPAKIVDRPDPGVSSSILENVTNGWVAQDHNHSTTLAAGRAYRAHGPATTGLFAIYRLQMKPFDQHTSLVEVPNAGTLRITKAPLGRNGAIWAQKRGKIEFTSTKGVTGTLHLKDDTVTLKR
jgi:hypothetical protein